MSQPGDSGDWLKWILGGIGIGGALWAIGAKVFNFVTRSDLAKIVEASAEQSKAQDRKFLEAQSRMQAEFENALERNRIERREIAQDQNAKIDKMHGENREVNEAIFERLLEVEKGQARIEGQLERSGRYPTIDPHAR